VVLDESRKELVQALLLYTVQHHLIETLSEEALSEAAHCVPRVAFVKDFDVIPLLQKSKDGQDLLVGFMPEGADALQDTRAEYLSNNCRRFQQ